MAIVAIVMTAGMGLAAASYCVWSHTFETTVIEPIEVEVTLELPETMEPGDLYNAYYLIHNTGSIPYTVTVTWPVSSADDDVCIWAEIRYSDAEEKVGEQITESGEKYAGTKMFKMDTDDLGWDYVSSYVRVRILVEVKLDAPPGAIYVPVTVSRG
ncbi:hypothetical protein ES703_62924 [subsurface metagenome]